MKNFLKTKLGWKLWIVITVVILSILVLFILILRKTTVSTKSDLLLDEQVLFPVMSEDGRSIFYFNNQNEAAFYKTDLIARQKQKISVDMDTPQNVLWSSHRDKVILKIIYNQYIFEKYGSPFSNYRMEDQSIAFWVYDFATNKFWQLDDRTTDAIWTRDSQKIAYLISNDERSSKEIYLVDPTGENQEIFAESQKNLYRILGADSSKNEIIIGINHGTEEQIQTEVYKIDINNKENFLFSAEVPSGIFLNRTASSATFVKDNNINLYRENTNILKLLENAEDTSVIWPKDNRQLLIFFHNKTSKNDEIWQVDLTTSKKTLIYHRGKSDLNIDKLIDLTNNNDLVFSADQRLYKLKIK